MSSTASTLTPPALPGENANRKLIFRSQNCPQYEKVPSLTEMPRSRLNCLQTGVVEDLVLKLIFDRSGGVVNVFSRNFSAVACATSLRLERLTELNLGCQKRCAKGQLDFLSGNFLIRLFKDNKDTGDQNRKTLQVSNCFPCSSRPVDN